MRDDKRFAAASTNEGLALSEIWLQKLDFEAYVAWAEAMP